MRVAALQLPAISNEDLQAVGAKYLPVVVEKALRQGDGKEVSILWQVPAARCLTCCFSDRWKKDRSLRFH